MGAAEAGHPLAQTFLGPAYCSAHFSGANVNSPLKKAAHWLRVAAAAGSAQAQMNYAFALYDGEEQTGVEQDVEQAAAWMRRAAEQLNMEACFWLGEFYSR